MAKAVVRPLILRDADDELEFFAGGLEMILALMTTRKNLALLREEEASK